VEDRYKSNNKWGLRITRLLLLGCGRSCMDDAQETRPEESNAGS
jgi:hypothetical protein